jgi:hypothetical protein
MRDVPRLRVVRDRLADLGEIGDEAMHQHEDEEQPHAAHPNGPGWTGQPWRHARLVNAAGSARSRPSPAGRSRARRSCSS